MACPLVGKLVDWTVVPHLVEQWLHLLGVDISSQTTGSKGHF